MPILRERLVAGLMAEHGRATDSGISLLTSEIAIDVIAWMGPLPFRGWNSSVWPGEVPCADGPWLTSI